MFVDNCTVCVSGYFRIDSQILYNVENNNSNNTIVYGYDCLTSCPNKTLSTDNVTCQQCTSPCLTCVSTLTQCLTCIQNYYLSSISPHQTCVSTCEQFSFPNTTSLKCQLCSTILSLNCYNCSSSTKCNECDDPAKSSYVYFRWNYSCLAVTPNGYVNISGLAEQCINNCMECAGTVSNCTKCTGLYNLYVYWDSNTNNTLGECLITCPSTYTGITNVCQQCQSPCL